MSWLFSPGLVEAFSAARCLGGERFVPWKLMLGPQAYFWPVKPIRFSRCSRFGMMLLPLMVARGEDVLTWFRAGSPARTSHAREKAMGSKEAVVDSGDTWPGSSMKLDLPSSSLKTRKCSRAAASAKCLATLPRWGTMLDGVWSERTMPAHLTSGTASGFWPTITVSGNNNRKGLSAKSGIQGQTEWDGRRGQSLVGAARGQHWPTPTVMDAAGFSGKPDKGRTSPNSGRTLNGKVLEMANRGPHFRTPNASDGRGWSHQSEQERRAKGQQVRLGHQLEAGGKLNPRWVEWLMGWPVGWTSLEPLAMDKFRLWQDSHGKY